MARLFMLFRRPICRAQVTWKAVKQLRFSHCIHAPTFSRHSEQFCPLSAQTSPVLRGLPISTYS